MATQRSSDDSPLTAGRDNENTASGVELRTVRRAIAAAAIGNGVEWFDYGVYAYVTTYVGAAFFGSEDPSNNIVYALAVLAVSFIVRPLGGLYFGSRGDKVGRRGTLATTIIVMSGATFLIGVLPPHDVIGLAAPILLLALRLVQGFSAGGEYGGAATYMAEYAPDDRRGLYVAFLEFGTLGGFTAGAAVPAVLTSVLSSPEMEAWGFRIPFLMTLPLGLIGLYLRSRLADTPEFRAAEKAGNLERAPIRRLFAEYKRPALICVGIVLFANVSNYTVLVYMPSYMQDILELDTGQSLALILVVQLSMMALILPIAALSDRIGRKPILMTAVTGSALLSLPCLLLMTGGTTLGVFAGLCILGILLVALLATLPSTLPALFPTSVRYAGFAISYNVSTSVFGGTAPLIIALLIDTTGDDLTPAYYLIAAAVIAAAPLYLLPETARRSLKECSDSARTLP